MNNVKNDIRKRSYLFSLRIFKICKYLENDKTARIIASQLLRSGTSVGANVEEASSGQSRKDFMSKMTISLKEAKETNYWLRLVRDSDTVPEEKIADLIDESEQLIKIIAKIIVTCKKSLDN
jgi:four helix bundle protein